MSKFKYNVGDTVKVLRCSCSMNRCVHKSFIGKTFTIDSVDGSNSEYPYSSFLDGNDFAWGDDEVELVTNNKDKTSEALARISEIKRENETKVPQLTEKTLNEQFEKAAANGEHVLGMSQQFDETTMAINRSLEKVDFKEQAKQFSWETESDSLREFFIWLARK